MPALIVRLGARGFANKTARITVGPVVVAERKPGGAVSLPPGSRILRGPDFPASASIRGEPVIDRTETDRVLLVPCCLESEALALAAENPGRVFARLERE